MYPSLPLELSGSVALMVLYFVTAVAVTISFLLNVRA
jgi:hypothetical protein